MPMPSSTPMSPASARLTEYISPLTAPATPNLPKSAGSSPRKPSARRAPRSPLPPHKLAKLANALGVSTPLPASTTFPSQTRRINGARQTDERSTSESRSVTPSSATGRTSSSRYLIHVVPPRHFPFENRDDPEALSAFRRGTLVPLHPSLQSQISAISREFQMPATHGIVLYLVGDATSGDVVDRRVGQGPRISDEVWKWLWMKVADESPMMRGVGLGFSSGVSSPALSERPSPLRKLSSSSQLEVSPRLDASSVYPLTPSSSSPSTSIPTSGPEQSTPSAPPPSQRSDSTQSSARSTTTGETNTPATSSPDLDARFLPGLGSPSLIPVLAKVEFDIDRQVGTWYPTWCRSRKSSQRRKAKKVDAQGKVPLRITINNKKGLTPSSSLSEDEEQEGYARLSDSPEQLNPDDELTAGVSSGHGDPLADVFGSDGETWGDIQATRPPGRNRGDLALDGASLSNPLNVDSADAGSARSDGEDVKQLWDARNKPQLSIPYPTTPSSSDKGSIHGTPQSMRKPVPPPLTLTPRGAAGIELNIATPTPSPNKAVFDPEDDTRLPYLAGSQDSSFVSGDGVDMLNGKRVGGIYDDIDLDLDLTADFDPDETRASQLKMRQELDVIERNLAQFSPRELRTSDLAPETAFASSPDPRSAPPGLSTFSMAGLNLRVQSPRGAVKHIQRDSKRVVPTIQQLQPARPSREMEEDISASPPAFRQPVLVGTPSPRADSFRGVYSADTANAPADGSDSLQAGWPAGRYPNLANRGEETPLSPLTSSPPKSRSKRLTNSPPKVVLNGKTNGSPKGSPKQRRKNSSSSSSVLNGFEPQARPRAQDEAPGYPGSMNLQPSLSRRNEGAVGSPVMPLSPDPFGRFPSSVGQSGVSSSTDVEDTYSSYIPPERTSSKQAFADTEPYERPPSKTPSSRFSNDSLLDEAAAANTTANAKSTSRANLVSVKSIKKLWRRTNKSSISGPSAMPSPADPSFMPSRPPSSAASLHDAEFGSSRAPSPSYPFTPGSAPMPSGRTSQASVRSNHTGYAQSAPLKTNKAQRDSGLDPFYFDQDSKYPVRRAQTPSIQTFPIRPATPPATSAPQSTSATPVTEKKRNSRKSILKWKSLANASSDGAGGRQSTDLSTETRRRRPSILDVAGNMMRGSVASANEVSPSVPELPAQYRDSRLSRASVSTAQNANGEERQQVQHTRSNSIRRKAAPSSSTDSSHASTDPIHTPVTAMGTSTFPNGNGPLVSPGLSDDLRSSFDDSQFEIVSPKVAPGPFYQYNTVDHDD